MKQCKCFSNNIIKFFASALHRESVLCLRPKICHTKQLVDRDTDTLSMRHKFALCCYSLRLDNFANYVFSLFDISNKSPPCLYPLGLRVLMATSCRSEISPAESLLLLPGSKNLHTTCKPQSPFSSPGDIPALPAVTWAVPLQAGQQHYQRHAAQWNSAKALHMFYAKENITFGTMFCTRSQLPPEYRCRTCQNKPNCNTSEVFCIFLPNCVQVCWIVWGKFIVLRNTKGWTV